MKKIISTFMFLFILAPIASATTKEKSHVVIGSPDGNLTNYVMRITTINRACPTWQSNTRYTQGDIVCPTTPNGFAYEAVNSTIGPSGNSEPTWPTTSGALVTDGSYVYNDGTSNWLCIRSHYAKAIDYKPTTGRSYKAAFIKTTLLTGVGTYPTDNTFVSAGVTWKARADVVFTEGHAASDYSDVKFIDSDNTTSLGYFALDTDPDPTVTYNARTPSAVLKASNGYIWIAEGNAIYRSTDNGATWSSALIDFNSLYGAGILRWYRIWEDSQGNIYASPDYMNTSDTNVAGLWRCPAGSTTFNRVIALGFEEIIWGLTETPDMGGFTTMYAGTYNQTASLGVAVHGAALWKSLDYGATWTLMFDKTTTPWYSGGSTYYWGDTSLTTLHLHDVRVDPYHPVSGHYPVYVATGDNSTRYIFKSIDEGATWTELHHGATGQKTQIIMTPNARVYFSDQGTTVSVTRSEDDIYIYEVWYTGNHANSSDLDLVKHKGLWYGCITAHTSGSTTEPGVGASWENQWTLLGKDIFFDGPDWVTSTSYTGAALPLEVGYWADYDAANNILVAGFTPDSNSTDNYLIISYDAGMTWKRIARKSNLGSTTGGITAGYWRGTIKNGIAYISTYSTGISSAQKSDPYMIMDLTKKRQIFDVKIPSLLTSASHTIYLMYGDGSSSSSNGANTYTVFDNFPGTTLDATRWDHLHHDATNTISLAINNGMKLSGVGIANTNKSENIRLKTSYTTTDNVTFGFKLKNLYTTGYSNVYAGFGSAENSSGNVAQFSAFASSYSRSGNLTNGYQNNTFENCSSFYSLLAPATYRLGNRAGVIEIKKLGINYILYGKDTDPPVLVQSTLAPNVNVYPTFGIFAGGYNYHSNADLEASFAYIKPLTTNEPTHGATGAEAPVASTSTGAFIPLLLGR